MCSRSTVVQSRETAMSTTEIFVVAILIFGVGNLILYSTTGIFFIPIPRR